MATTPIIDRRISELKAEYADILKFKKKFRDKNKLDRLGIAIKNLGNWKKDIQKKKDPIGQVYVKRSEGTHDRFLRDYDLLRPLFIPSYFKEVKLPEQKIKLAHCDQVSARVGMSPISNSISSNEPSFIEFLPIKGDPVGFEWREGATSIGTDGRVRQYREGEWYPVGEVIKNYIPQDGDTMGYVALKYNNDFICRAMAYAKNKNL